MKPWSVYHQDHHPRGHAAEVNDLYGFLIEVELIERR